MNYRISETMYTATDTFQRAANQLIRKADALEETGDVEYAVEAFAVLKNIHNNIHLDNGAIKRDIEELTKKTSQMLKEYLYERIKKHYF